MLATDSELNNLFHALAALGDFREATKLLSSTPKKVLSTGLVAKNKSGATPLHIAAQSGNLRLLNLFIEAVGDACDNTKCNEGFLYRDRLSRKFKPHGKRVKLHRFMTLDKLGLVNQEFDEKYIEAVSMAASTTSTILIGHQNIQFDDFELQEEGFELPRAIYSVLKDSPHQIDLDERIPIAAATSNLHSVVLTNDNCVFTWGKNNNGILGVDLEEKVVTQPAQVLGSFMSSSTSGPSNTFSMLQSNTRSVSNQRSVRGVACSDFFSAVHTANKVWVWGVNRGQMMNKEIKHAVVEEPLMVYESQINIKKMVACDSALILLLENGQTVQLKNDRVSPFVVGKIKQANEIIELKARGDYLAVMTTEHRILRFNMGTSVNNVQGDVMWTSRHSLDTPRAFDIGESGILVVATQRGVYRVEEKGSVSELKAFRGVSVCDIVFNLHGYTAIADLDVDIVPKNSTPFTVQWVNAFDYDFKLYVDGNEVPVHKAVLFARCRTLRGLIDSESKQTVGVPGGSAVFKLIDDKLTVLHAPLKSVQTFVTALYLSNDKKSREQSELLTKALEAGPERFEYSALVRLMSHSLSTGLWDAQKNGISCDVHLANVGDIHSSVINAASPVLQAHLNRWKAGVIDASLFGIESIQALKDVIFYIYTSELNIEIDFLKPECQAERIFYLWQAADILLIPQLMELCEDRLVALLDYDILVTCFEIVMGLCNQDTQRMAKMLLRCMAVRATYVLPSLKEMPNDCAVRFENEFLKGDIENSKELNELAQSYQTLRGQSQLRSATQKNRKLSTNKKDVSTSPSPHTTPSPSPTPGPSRTPTPTIRPEAMPASKPATSAWSMTPPPSSGEGWITAGKKRTGSSSIDRSTIVRPTATPTRPITRTAAPSPSVSTPTPPPQTPSPLSTLPKLGDSLPKLGSSLPKLGTSLPKLGEKPASKKTSKAKFKGNAMSITALELEQRNEAGPSSSTPWKRVPVVETRGVLEQLERAKSRKPGSVWGV